jgi:hypothetical protein
MLQRVLKNQKRGWGLDPFSSRQAPAVGSYEHNNETLCSIKLRKFLEWLSDS